MNWNERLNSVMENEFVCLRLIQESDREELHRLTKDIDIWKYFVFRVSNENEFDVFFKSMLADNESGCRAVYAVIDKVSGSIAGSMCYGNLNEKDARLEIGWSWLGKDYRGKGINRWAKFLLLENAFENLKAFRVEFKTDVLNQQARSALRNIAAKEDGVLRSYNFMPDGRRRDTIFYSILANEWPEIKSKLLVSEKIK